MAVKRLKHPAGLVLIEVMMATVVLVIAVLGTSFYRYTAALNAREADRQMTAARIASTLCESWRGAGDPNEFDVGGCLGTVSSGTLILSIDVADYGPAVPDGFSLLNHCQTEIKDEAQDAGETYYQAALSWKDVAPGLRALSVIVVWDLHGPNSAYLPYSTYFNRSLRLTTYVTY
jgi:hypothetical protein